MPAPGLYLTILALGLLAFAENAMSADWYVRPSSAGANNGTNWNNAWSTASIGWSSVKAGDTLWLAGGTHGTFTMSATNGTAANPVYVKRVLATDAVPAAAAGWSASFDSLVVITGPIWFPAAKYVTIDGRTNYGIKLNYTETGMKPQTSSGIPKGPTTGVHLLHMEFAGPGKNITYGSCALNWSTWTDGVNNDIVTDPLVSSCYFHDSDGFIYMGGWTNGIIESNKFYNCLYPTSGVHPDVIYSWPSYNIDIRYNDIRNCDTEAIFFSYAKSDNIRIYGNALYNLPGITGMLGITVRASDGTPNWVYGRFYIWNNVISGFSLGISFSGIVHSNSEVYNNIFWDSVNSCLQSGQSINADYNGYNTGKPSRETNSYQSATDPFVSMSTGNYRLSAGSWPINRGKTVRTDGYVNKDADGKIRGADGIWDIGTFEYGSSPATNPAIVVSPSSLDFGIQLTNTSNTLTLTVQNGGQGTLTGTASVSAPFQIVSGGTYSLGSTSNQTVTIRYNPTVAGTANQTVAFTSNGGSAGVNVNGLAYVLQPSLSFDSSAGTILAPFTVANVSSMTVAGMFASATISSYISQTSETGLSDGGQAVYGFNIANAGNYVVSAWVNAPSSGANSFFLNIDGQPTDPTMIWDIPVTSGFTNRLASWRGTGTDTNSQFSPKIFTLSSGPHRLVVRGREGGAQLAGLIIAPVPTAPTGLHVVSP